MTRHDPAIDGPFQQLDDGVMVHLTAFPKSRKNEIAGVRNGRMMVKVTAPPEDGKANDAIVKLLAKALDIPGSAVELISGATSREKSIKVEGLTSVQVAEAFGL